MTLCKAAELPPGRRSYVWEDPFAPFRPPPGETVFLGYYGGKSWPPTLKAGGPDKTGVPRFYIWGGNFILEGGGILRRFTGLL